MSEQLMLDFGTGTSSAGVRQFQLGSRTLRVSECFDVYWRFAAERQRVFHQRAAGAQPPWTTDPVLSRHKFTNVYRAADRVSQYLIRDVIYAKLIAWIADSSHEHFARLGLEFADLWGRWPALIDWQNVFCEVSKYTRVTHPHVRGPSGRTRIKQEFRKTPAPIDYRFPPKWGLPPERTAIVRS